MSLPRRLAALHMILALTVTGFAAPQAVGATPTTVTNLSHLDFLLDEVSPAAVPGRDT